MYFKDAHAAILVYDVTFRESFESCKKWVQDLNESVEEPDILIALVGNKSDKYDESVVSYEEAMDFAKTIKAEIIKETSAKDNVGVSDLFVEIATKLYKKHKQKLQTELNNVKGHRKTLVPSEKAKKDKKKPCC